MRNTKKVHRILACLLITAVTLSLLLLSGCGEAKDPYPEPTERFFVNDFADLLAEADEQTIYNAGVQLQEKTTAQVVAVTVETLDGKEPADYALELGRKWGVGDAEKDNGVVLLLAEEERQIYVAVGYGLEGGLPDSKTGRLIDHYALPDLREDRFSAGMTALYRAIVNEVYLESGMQPEEGYVPADQLQDDEEVPSVQEVAISWAVLLVLVVLAVWLSRRRGIFFGPFIGPFGGGGFGGFSGGGGSFGGGGAGRGF
ncbi:MAG: TPM domain-containing protein [Clostridia bacterium]|nr:TPM domain-containing protein [Clostridia bacterium]